MTAQERIAMTAAHDALLDLLTYHDDPNMPMEELVARAEHALTHIYMACPEFETENETEN